MKRELDINNIVKVGTQDPDNPLKYILSTAVVDRMGDIVEQDWQLKDFKLNPIALFMHGHRDPIGTWDKIKVEKINGQDALTAYLNIAEAGTSALIDTVRSLIKQKILKAVSVGFSVGGYEVRYDENNNYEGYTLKSPSLHEASIVSVPANQEALQIAKSFNISDNDMKSLFAQADPGSADETVETDPLQKQKNKMALLKLSAR